MLGLFANSGSPISSLGGTAYGVSITETTTLTHTQNVLATFLSTNNETITLTNSQSGLVTFLTSLADTTTLTQTQTGSTGFFLSLADTSTITDVWSASNFFTDGYADTITLTDARRDKRKGLSILYDINKRKICRKCCFATSKLG